MFAPDDEIDPTILANNPDLTSNYEEALKSAKKIGTTNENCACENDR